MSIPQKYGFMLIPISVIHISTIVITWESSVNLDTFFHGEILIDSWLISAFCYPNLVSRGGSINHRLKISRSINPRRAVSNSSLLNVSYLLCCCIKSEQKTNYC